MALDSASIAVRASTTSRDVFWYSTRSRTGVLMPLSSPAASRRKMAASILMRPVNQWVVVRDSLEEPKLFRTNSRPFRLTPHLAELAGNGQYCGKAVLSELAGVSVGLPQTSSPGRFGCVSQSLR